MWILDAIQDVYQSWYLCDHICLLVGELEVRWDLLEPRGCGLLLFLYQKSEFCCNCLSNLLYVGQALRLVDGPAQAGIEVAVICCGVL